MFLKTPAYALAEQGFDPAILNLNFYWGYGVGVSVSAYVLGEQGITIAVLFCGGGGLLFLILF